MAAQLGNELLLKIHDGTEYQLIGGFTSNTLDITSESVEVTTKDHEGFKELLESGSVRSLATNAEGVFMNDAMYAVVHGHMLAGTHPDCQIIIPGFGTYSGKFEITSLKLTGTTDAAVTYGINLVSAGPITFAAGS